jgi:hypothetical protein
MPLKTYSTMTNSELFYFTGKCLTINDHPEFREEIIEKIAADSFDWEKFIELCSNNLILPVIYLKFKSHEILEYLPEEVSEFLKEIYDLNHERNTQIRKQLQEITVILNNGNIYPIYLKGAGHLLNGLYAYLGERMMVDIDLLVPEKEYIKAAQLMESEGYSVSGEFVGEFDNEFYGEDAESLKHYPPLVKEGSPAHIEIHRLAVEADCQSWFNSELIDTEKKSVSILKGCFVLSDKHNIIHNFIHSQLGHEGHIYGIVSLRDLYDLYLLSKRFEVQQTLQCIKPKQKAIAYFAFADKALGLNMQLFQCGNFSSWIFIKKHDLNLSSKNFYFGYRAIIYFIQRVIIGFTGQIIKSFYSRKMRYWVIKRLTNRQYVMAHLQSYKSFFITKKKV